MPKRGLLIGLTGSIACGKSTVAKILATHGARHIDADLMAHSTYEPGTTGFKQIIEAFGQEFLSDTGTIDRKALGNLVFSDPAQLKKLTDIVWPLTAGLIRETAKAHQESEPERPVVLEAAVLIQAGWHEFTDEIWYVTCPKDQQLQRLMKRNQLSEDEARLRISSQKPLPALTQTVVRNIENSDTESRLMENLQDIIHYMWRDL